MFLVRTITKACLEMLVKEWKETVREDFKLWLFHRRELHIFNNEMLTSKVYSMKKNRIT